MSECCVYILNDRRSLMCMMRRYLWGIRLSIYRSEVQQRTDEKLDPLICIQSQALPSRERK
jgi:hypothetical protein